MDVQREYVQVVTEALQLAWDDFVTDTGCFPDCFTLGPNRTLMADFGRGNFASFVAGWLKARGVVIGRHLSPHGGDAG